MYYNRLEIVAKEKHCTSLGTFRSYEDKMFCEYGPWWACKIPD